MTHIHVLAKFNIGYYKRSNLREQDGLPEKGVYGVGVAVVCACVLLGWRIASFNVSVLPLRVPHPADHRVEVAG
jgi:hypothetical protein